MLFQAGKEILLKSVIQAIPTYLMGVYKISTGVIEDIRSMMARFFWGDDNEVQRKIYWKCWEDLCAPKCLGGLGFRDLEVFSMALLGRQAWHLASTPSSLLNKVFSAK